VLQRSVLGFEIRTSGAAPHFARLVGMPVGRAQLLATAGGGVFGGLAGLHLSHGLLERLPYDLQPGIGVDGLVVALLARLEPAAIPLAALFYAWLRGGARAMERGSDVAHEMAYVIEAVMVLLVIVQHWPLQRPAWLSWPSWLGGRHGV
jgi:simple sugar transport system permease protein